MSKKKKQKLPEKKSNKTLMYAAIAVLAVVVIAALILLFPSAPKENPTDNLLTTQERLKLNSAITYEPGKIKITEFLKFNCPFCYRLHTNLPQILQKYGDNVTITYVPIVWPGESTKSIEAYIIADQMGKGKEMQDAIFNEAAGEGLTQGNENLMLMDNVQVLERVAASIGLGADFNAELEGNDAHAAALVNLEFMNKYSVQATPTIIINGNRTVNPATADNLDTVIGSLLS